MNEIYRWLKNFEHKTIDEDIIIKKWIAIDDVDLLKLDEKRMENHLVLTTNTHGITEQTVKEAALLLLS